uniref:Low-density lipoprotein receptor domain class A n=1 Tax=Angiostrongylus cantonensis TaxID=6313 RepID=A0A0K0D4M8_ANGCA
LNEGIKQVARGSDGDFNVVTIDSLPVASQLYLYENKTYPVSNCLENNGGCEQLCFPGVCSSFQKCDDVTPKCGCADGFLVDTTDSTKCVANPAANIGKCEPSEFMCKHTEICIPKEKVCDKKWDCLDGSDEDIRDVCVANFSCSSGEFLCDSLTCIPNRLLCDGRADCEDRSDEGWAVCKGEKESNNRY